MIVSWQLVRETKKVFRVPGRNWICDLHNTGHCYNHWATTTPCELGCSVTKSSCSSKCGAGCKFDSYLELWKLFQLFLHSFQSSYHFFSAWGKLKDMRNLSSSAIGNHQLDLSSWIQDCQRPILQVARAVYGPRTFTWKSSILAKGPMVELTTLNVSMDAISLIILNMILVAVLWFAILVHKRRNGHQNVNLNHG